jgi:zinc/manganese transport system substrate-binding protein
MRRFLRFSLLALISLGGALAPVPAQAKPEVVVTLADLWALTKPIAGDLLEVKLATRLGQNPHDLEIRPSQILLVKRAEILVRNSLEEDAWVDPIVESSGNPRLLRGSPNVIEAGLGIRVLDVPATPVDRSLGDIHPLGNPHYCLDPANVPIVTANVLAGLSRLFPDLAPKLEANRQAFLAKLADADRRWKQTMAPFKGTKLVAYHKTWPYFYRAFGLVEAGTIEDRPGIPPSPQHVATLIRQMKDEKIRVILIETWYPLDVANFVARETGAHVVVVPQTPGSLKGTEEYIAHMDALVNTIAKALGGAA